MAILGQSSVKEARSAAVLGRGVKPNLLDKLAGDDPSQATWTPILPGEMVGGSVPYIAGQEDNTVWHAGVQACGTERIHYVFTVAEGRCWYLATPSSSLAGSGNPWCPLAAALPGNPEFWDKQTVYLYEQEGQAGALRWDPDSGRMQLFIGPSRTILPRIQSLEANFVTINAEMLTPIPWKNKSLNTDKLSRAFARVVLYGGLVTTVISVFYLFALFLWGASLQPSLEKARADSAQVTTELMTNATNALKNDTTPNLIRVQELLDTLVQVQGTLVRYEVNGGALEWEALVPKSYSAGDVPEFRGAQITGSAVEKDGRVRIKGTQ